MPFFDESESFVHGFECGKIWEKIEQGEVFDSHLIHTENIKQIELMCKTFNVDFEISVVNETWSYLTLMPQVVAPLN